MNQLKNPTTIRIPVDITRKIRKMREEKNLPSLWRAVEIYFEEKHKEQIERLQEDMHKLSKVSYEVLSMKTADIAPFIWPSIFFSEVTRAYFLEHPNKSKQLDEILARTQKSLDKLPPGIVNKSKQIVFKEMKKQGLIK